MTASGTTTLILEATAILGLWQQKKKCQADSPPVDEEELLWQMERLGDHSPQALSHTMNFMNGVYFALRSTVTFA